MAEEDTIQEQVSWHLPDGTPTSDKDAATTVEVIQTASDGSTTHRLMRQVPQKGESDE